MSVCVPCVSVVPEDQKMAPSALELELQIRVCCQCGYWESNPGPLAEDALSQLSSPSVVFLTTACHSSVTSRQKVNLQKDKNKTSVVRLEFPFHVDTRSHMTVSQTRGQITSYSVKQILKRFCGNYSGTIWM